ncbi:peptidoglycan DD-metalloendopeptidase family protein [Endozoicomonas sp. SM1973]|uniref:Peptidoglycan DD-metalloendopeptidase family protein n=1 Tax=Spartinivicinus marinus TaxID=2994442 RepID=A0A853I0H2_9GAMM|nr:peptidoglycan DD-metalloendopeptidase family protein [Spartinivicinus marinus]MCX4027179.1 peptidoglycan DD-metalloendopeptidase family protein [Spartinivicinus marinus]NYZ66099.1 peptidoglycan DD-metalloendopeptidase family protein [Spartinivicinus marinus]
MLKFIFSLTKQLYKPICICLISGTALLNSSVSWANPELQEKEKQLKQLQAEIKKTQQLLKKIQQQRSNVQQSLQTSEQEMERLHKKVQEIESRLQEGQQQLKKLHTRQHQLSVAKRQQQQQLEQTMLLALYTGQNSNIKMLLNQQQPTDVARTQKYLGYLAQARQQKVTEFNQTIQSLTQVSQQIEATNTKLTQQQLALAKQQQALTTQKAKRRLLLKQLEQELAAKDQTLASQQKERSELEQVLKTLAKTITPLPLPGTPFYKQRGKLPWPIQGKVTNRYGSLKKQTKLKWQGLFIQSNEGSPVSAVHHGRVVFSDWLRGSGLLIIVDHGGGYMSLYAHNQTLLKETGEWVKAGEAIATAGNTGGNNETGLYFEIRHKGQPQNPSGWIVAGR